MLSENTLKLLGALGEQCKDYSYKVFCFSEIAPAFIKDENFDEQTVRENVEILEKNGYVSVKYIDEEQVCLSVLEKGRQALKVNAETETMHAKNSRRNMAWAFLGAFIGSSFGWLVLVVMRLVLGGR